MWGRLFTFKQQKTEPWKVALLGAFFSYLSFLSAFSGFASVSLCLLLASGGLIFKALRLERS